MNCFLACLPSFCLQISAENGEVRIGAMTCQNAVVSSTVSLTIQDLRCSAGQLRTELGTLAFELKRGSVEAQSDEGDIIVAWRCRFFVPCVR